LVFTVGCGGNDPVAPTPIAPARVISEGGGFFSLCSSVICQFSAPIRNVGAGCATNVRGTTTFYNTAHQQIGPVVNWTLAVSQILRPNEAVSVPSTGVQSSNAQQTSTYITEPFWTDVRCP
jgi:hypothetical protein